MKSMRRFLGLIFFLVLFVSATRPVSAARGIYCTSYEYVAMSRQMVCRIVCIYCYDLDEHTDVSENCYEASCWFREY